MAQKRHKQLAPEDDMTVGELARMINSAFIKQGEHFEQILDQKLEQNRKEIFDEIDAREYITKKDLDDRGYSTKYDLQDAVIDIKDEITRTVTPRLTRLEQKS